MTVNTIQLIQFPYFKDTNGVLSVYESFDRVPFDIKRVFTVSAKAFDIRGEHAHKKCIQLLICIQGKIKVSCDDGTQVSNYTLTRESAGLLVPPGVWAKEEYLIDDSILMVLCDRGYEQDDYIREYNEFLSWTSCC
jgi:dTDP-4-dehydrorhamnose 3,5-epimerase-like enzyme